jgi:hypothetical protein
MKRYLTTLSRYVFPILFISLLFIVEPLRSTQASAVATPVVRTLIDEFNGTSLDLSTWDIFHGTPTVANGRLTLAGGVNTTAEIQSVQKFGYGVVQMVITSSNWKPYDQITDSSFGFEIWQGANVRCQYSVILVANGHLGLIKQRPDANGNCSGDPILDTEQVYEQISAWDQIRSGRTVRLTLTWAPRSVTLHISSAGVNEGVAFYTGPVEPVNGLEIRLNADKGETYRIDYVRVVGIPWR